MKKMLILISALVSGICFASDPATYVPSAEAQKSRQEFSEARFGIFVHWGIYSMLGDGEWVQENHQIPFSEYSHLAGGFYPSRFDAGEWAKVFKDSGAKYVTFTSRHHDGFSMFHSDCSEYNIVDKTPFRRDILSELASACADAGLKLNLYYSLIDWGRGDFTPAGETGKMPRDGRSGGWRDYLDFMNAQLTELLSNYGPIGCIWLDGAWDKKIDDRELWGRTWNYDEMYSLVHRLQPSCLIGNNHHVVPWPGEDIQIFERDVPGQHLGGHSDGQEIYARLPLETCQTINGPWGYKIGDNECKSLQTLIQLLARTAGKDANLLLNIGPRPDGTLPEDAVERLLEMGQWLKANGESIYGTRGDLLDEREWGVLTYRDRTLYVHDFGTASSIHLDVSAKENKVLSVKRLSGSGAVPYVQSKDGITITLEPDAGRVDDVIVVSFKKDIAKEHFR